MADGDSSPGPETCSLNDFFTKDIEEDKIFAINNISEDIEMNAYTGKFYQIKKKLFDVNNSSSCVIQIIDISTTVRFQKLIGEKRLLEIINALVSHEMRNPL